jgi:hypothetical protein
MAFRNLGGYFHRITGLQKTKIKTTDNIYNTANW